MNEQNLTALWEDIRCHDMHGILGTGWQVDRTNIQNFTEDVPVV